jgi:hypothetical protein
MDPVAHNNQEPEIKPKRGSGRTIWISALIVFGLLAILVAVGGC